MSVAPDALVVVLRVAGEGGGLALLGRRTTHGWTFAVRLRGELLTDCDGGAPWTPDFSAALRVLDTYPWAKLMPREVHPEFRARVLAEVEARLGANPQGHALRMLLEWRDLLA